MGRSVFCPFSKKKQNNKMEKNRTQHTPSGRPKFCVFFPLPPPFRGVFEATGAPPALQKHKNSTRRRPERLKKNELGAREGKKSEILGGPAEGRSGVGWSGAGVVQGSPNQQQPQQHQHRQKWRVEAKPRISVTPKGRERRGPEGGPEGWAQRVGPPLSPVGFGVQV